MPSNSSPEATILAEFLLAPAPLREVLTPQQFTDIFPKGLRSSPAVKQLYQELQRLRREDIEIVQKNIAAEVSASKSLRRQSTRARQIHDRSAIAGLDPVALNIEDEVRKSSPLHLLPYIVTKTHIFCRSPGPVGTRTLTRSVQSNAASTERARNSSQRSRFWRASLKTYLQTSAAP